MDSLRQDYESFAYGGGAIRQTHPGRLAGVAELHGVKTVPVPHARVLEVGCSRGCNLLPLAVQFPEASFTGIDFTTSDIKEARQMARDAGLNNIKFIDIDLRKYAPEPASFDYIIVHGVFSWVPDEAKAAILRLCSHALSALGVAYVSYNTYPGWKKREVVRDLMLMHTAGTEDPSAKLEKAGAVLKQFDLISGHEKTPHAQAIKDMIADIRRKSAVVVYHDELGSINDPCYFAQFINWAAEYELAFVSEAEFETAFAERLRPQLDTISLDRLQREQWMDIGRDRQFRCTLLTHQDRVREVSPNGEALRDYVFGADFKPAVGLPDLRPDTPASFASSTHGASFKSDHPQIKAIYTVLADAWPQRLPFAQLRDEASGLLTKIGVDPSDNEESDLLQHLLEGCGRRFIDFGTTFGPACATQVSSHPRASKLTRLAAGKYGETAGFGHENVRLDPDRINLLATLDGTRSKFSPDERKQLQSLAAVGLLVE